jgi:hypothetical protein
LEGCFVRGGWGGVLRGDREAHAHLKKMSSWEFFRDTAALPEWCCL